MEDGISRRDAFEIFEGRSLRADSGAITLLVSDRFATVRMADLIVYLEDVHAAESGTHDALMASGGRYAELFTLQAAGYT